MAPNFKPSVVTFRTTTRGTLYLYQGPMYVLHMAFKLGLELSLQADKPNPYHRVFVVPLDRPVCTYMHVACYTLLSMVSYH